MILFSDRGKPSIPDRTKKQISVDNRHSRNTAWDESITSTLNKTNPFTRITA